jgi:hypothetical protein
MARFKITGPLGDEYGIEYVVNPGGAIWAVRADHVSPSWVARKAGDVPVMLAEVAEKRQDGWRLATDEEIRKHCAESGDELPVELTVEPEPEPEPGPEPVKPPSVRPPARASSTASAS